MYVRFLLKCIKGLINKIDAPVVPTKLARKEAIVKRQTFLKGVLRECRWMWMPPAMVNNAKISATNGMYSFHIVSNRICEAQLSVVDDIITATLNVPQKARIWFSNRCHIAGASSGKSDKLSNVPQNGMACQKECMNKPRTGSSSLPTKWFSSLRLPCAWHSNRVEWEARHARPICKLWVKGV